MQAEVQVGALAGELAEAPGREPVLEFLEPDLEYLGIGLGFQGTVLGLQDIDLGFPGYQGTVDTVVEGTMGIDHHPLEDSLGKLPVGDRRDIFLVEGTRQDTVVA